MKNRKKKQKTENETENDENLLIYTYIICSII